MSIATFFEFGPVTLGLFLPQVVQVGLYGQPPRPVSPALPGGVSQTNADFGGMVQLVGYRTDQSNADRLVLDLYWQATAQVNHPYIVFVHLVNAQQRIVAQHDGRPQNGQPLMTCWQPGEIYHDQHVIQLEPNIPAGTHTLQVGLYHSLSGARLTVRQPTGVEADHVTLGQIEIEPAGK